MREKLRIFGPAVLLTLAGFVVAYQFVEPAPPTHIVIGAGAPEGAYHAYAIRYSQILARHGVDLEVRSTAGSVENIRLLREEGGVQVALVQGGTTSENSPGKESGNAPGNSPGKTAGKKAGSTPGNSPGAAPREEGVPLVSLASLYFEPLWVFHRKEVRIESLRDLAGRRIALGPEESGTRAVALALLKENDVGQDTTTLLDLGGREAASALIAAEIDAAFFVASPTADVVKDLARAEGVDIMDFRRSDAYARVHRFLSSLRLPEGVLDFERNLPPVDKRLVAPTANLVAREDLHPALVDLLLQAATEVHGSGGIFERLEEFPSTLYLDFPLSADAARFFKYGPSFLQRYLPFWAATLIERTKVMLLPLIALLFPLFRVMPPAYRWRVRSRIYRWYRKLLALDLRVRAGRPSAEVERDLEELDALETDVKRQHVPLSYADELFTLRLHIDLVREKVRASRGPEGASGSGRGTAQDGKRPETEETA